jgi:site-specific DNA recombinase
MRVAIYARYSSENQRDGYSIAAQLEACRHALPPGEHDICEYIDRACSGATIAGRPEVQRMTRAVLAGKHDLVIVYKYDRLGRNTAETCGLFDDIEDAGARVESATEGVDPFARELHVVFGKQYLRQLSERTRLGNRKAAEAGHIGGPAPYGYRRTADKQWEVDPKTSPIVRRIFSESADAGQSFKGIAETLNAAGHPSARGGHWGAGAIRAILKNEVYKGTLIFNQRHYKKNRRTGRRICTINPREDWLIMDRPDLALIDAALFDRSQRAQESRRRGAFGRSTRRTYPLSSLVKCAECGSTYFAQRSTNPRGAYTYYTCGGRQNGGGCGNLFRFRQDIVMGEIMRQLSETIFSADAVEAIKARLVQMVSERMVTGDSELQDIRAQLEARRRVAGGIRRQMVEADLRGDSSAGWIADLRREESSLAALESREAELQSGPRLDLAHLQRVIEQSMERQRQGIIEVRDPVRLREALRVQIGEITAHPDGTLTYKTRPVSLTETAGPQCRVLMVAGVRFAQEVATITARSYIVDYARVRAMAG